MKMNSSSLSKLAPFLLATACSGSKPSVDPEVSAAFETAQGILRELTSDCSGVMAQQEVHLNGPSTGDHTRNEQIYPEDFSEKWHFLGSAIDNGSYCLCANGQWAKMTPEESLTCVSAGTTGASPNEIGISITGVGLPIPQGAIHDPITGSTRENDGMYGVKFYSMSEDVEFMLDPEAETATLSYGEEAEAISAPFDYETASDLRVQALTELYSIRNRFPLE